MSQQLVNGSERHSDVTITNRMSYRYAVVNPPFEGKHRKPQDEISLMKRKAHWAIRNYVLKSKRGW